MLWTSSDERRTRGMMPRVTLRVLGCGDAFASGGRLQTCFFLDAGPDRLLIDCGATAMVGMRRFGVDQSVRASLAFYNTREDVDVFLKALHTLPRR